MAARSRGYVRGVVVAALLMTIALVAVFAVKHAADGSGPLSASSAGRAVEQQGPRSIEPAARPPGVPRQSTPLPLDIASDPFGVRAWGGGSVAIVPGSSDGSDDEPAEPAGATARLRPTAPPSTDPTPMPKSPSPADRAPGRGSEWRSPPPSD